jgi:hypothetical protein
MRPELTWQQKEGFEKIKEIDDGCTSRIAKLWWGKIN